MSLAQSLCIGSIGFSVVSTVVFATVAFGEGWLYGHLGVALTYAFWTLIFILGGGTVAARLNRGFRSIACSYATFALAFFLYAAGWMAAYFALKLGLRELFGVIAGTVLMSLTFAWAGAAKRDFAGIFLILLLTNTAGYFAGRCLWRAFGGHAGMIAWGVLFGLGLGFGLGYVFYACRTPSRAKPPPAG